MNEFKLIRHHTTTTTTRASNNKKKPNNNNTKPSSNVKEFRAAIFIILSTFRVIK
jgi:hypothetical protein